MSKCLYNKDTIWLDQVPFCRNMLYNNTYFNNETTKNSLDCLFYHTYNIYTGAVCVVHPKLDKRIQMAKTLW